ncbi:MAG: DUF2851 family protein [Fulvivirga sp.]|nr:DUF2851 family protein [Fulvivirga sp.]
MSEAFLHYIWKYQYFNKEALETDSGESVQIFKPGYYNTDSGPDFKEATVLIGQIEWRGHVEIHYRASDWIAHAHHKDRAYNNTVLHVVWENDKEVKRQDGSLLPTITLKGRVLCDLQDNYERLIENPQTVACRNQLGDQRDIVKLSMMDKVVLERLQRKSTYATDLYHRNMQDWEKTAFQLMAQSFGFKKNNEPFLNLAQSIPFKVLKKHADQMMQIEAILFGQSGFLDPTLQHDDPYHDELKKEYDFLRKKYNLERKVEAHHWKFLRMRPANFPTLRIAQLAAFIRSSPNLFSVFLECQVEEIVEKLRSDTTDYWKSHFRFGKRSNRKVSRLGKKSAESICINTVAPLLVAYSKSIDDERFLNKALDLLQKLPSEKNSIVHRMERVGFTSANAFDSQGIIELHNNYCLQKRCLSCNIGNAIVRP